MLNTTTEIPDDVRELLTRARGNSIGTWSPMVAAIDALRKARGLPPDTSKSAGEFDRFREQIDVGDVNLDRETRAVANDVLAGRLPPPLTRAEARARIVQRLDGTAAAPAPTSAKYLGTREIAARLRDDAYGVSVSVARLLAALRKLKCPTVAGRRGKVSFIATEAQIVDLAEYLRAAKQ